MSKRGTGVPAPKTLHDALEMALRDLDEVAKTKGYVIDMGTWHTPMQRDEKNSPSDKPLCHVCLAGSVMARTHRAARYVEVEPHRFTRQWYDVFLALDDLRMGDVRSAFETFYSRQPEGDEIDKCLSLERDSQYESSPDLWREDMTSLLSGLKGAGL